MKAPALALIGCLTLFSLAASANRPAEHVAPGKVSWHADYDAALAASKKSGKPVLLFQLLGDLDQRFS